MKFKRQVLDHLTDEALFCILEATSFADIQNFENKIFSKEQLAWLAIIAKNSPVPVKNSSNKITESILDSLTPTSYLALLLDAGFTLITSIALAPFITIGISFMVLFLVVGGVNFIATYKEIKEKDQEENERFQFLALRNECADIYLRKKQKNPFLPEVINQKKLDAKPGEKKWQNAKGVLGAAVLVTGALFYTYYAITQGLVIALAGSLVVSALAGPIGVGVALALFMVVGAYFGYKKYQSHKKEQALQHQRDGMKNEFKIKYRECQRVRPKTDASPIVEVRNVMIADRKSRDPEKQARLGPFLFQRGVETTNLPERAASEATRIAPNFRKSVTPS